jgi:hypothetical protein
MVKMVKWPVLDQITKFSEARSELKKEKSIQKFLEKFRKSKVELLFRKKSFWNPL